MTAMNNKKVVFVDDEAFYADKYVRELKQIQLDVSYFDNAEAGLDYLKKLEPFFLLVLDIMMPTPTEVPPIDTNDGLTTGLWVLNEIKEKIAKYSIPVVFLTNRDSELIEEHVQQLELPENLVIVRQKLHTSSTRFADIVKTQIDVWYTEP